MEASGMKTKRQVLKSIAQYGYCAYMKCSECPYYKNTKPCPNDSYTLKRFGAMALLRMFPEKQPETETPSVVEIDESKVYTCVTADKAKVGMKGYFADNLQFLRFKLIEGNPLELTEILGDDCWSRFRSENNYVYALFYPIEETE